MGTRIPKHALTFMANSAKLAAKVGLKKGLSKAATKVNPALLVIEAVASVADAINSFLHLKEAKEHRDGLQRILPQEEQRLLLERQQLADQLDLAKKEIDLNVNIQKRLGELVLSCGIVCKKCWEDLHTIRKSDFPDLEEFDKKFIILENAWDELQHALKNYNEFSI